MERLKDYILNEELDDNIFWKIDNYYKDRDEELKSFNGLVDICRTNKGYNTDTINAYLSGNAVFNKNIKNFVDYIYDTVKPDPSINTDYTKSLHNIVKTVISNKSDGIKYTNIK